MRLLLLTAIAPLLLAAAPADDARRQQLVDEHARWNAQHMAAVRRLNEVAAALRRHDTSFDVHAAELRDTRPRSAGEWRQLEAAHAEARRVHDRLMAEVEDLERVIHADLTARHFASR